MNEVDDKTALASCENIPWELLLQPVQRLTGRDHLVRGVDPAAPARTLHTNQMAIGDPDLHPVVKDLQPHKRGKPEAGTPEHRPPQVLH